MNPRRTLFAFLGGLIAYVGCYWLGAPSLRDVIILALVPPIVPGIVIGLLSDTRRSAVVAGALAPFVATYLVILQVGVDFQLMATAGPLPLSALGAAVVCAAVAAGVRSLPEKPAAWAPYVALALVVGGMWWQGILGAHTFKEMGELTPAKIVSQSPEVGTIKDDQLIYLRIYYLMEEDGLGYYEAAQRVRGELAPDRPPLPTGAVSERLPTLFWIWTLSPFSAEVSIIWGLLLLGTGAICSAYYLVSRIAPPALGVAAAALSATYFARAAGTLTVLSSEWWACAAGMISAALWFAALDTRGRRRLGFTWAAAATALLAGALREIAGFYLLAGLVSAWYVMTHPDPDPDPEIAEKPGDSQPLTDLRVPWIVGCVGLVLVYAAHTSASGGSVLGQGLSFDIWFGSSAQRPMNVIEHGADWLLGGNRAAYVLLALTAVGLYRTVKGPARSYFAVATVAATLATFFTGPWGRMAGSGEEFIALGYWGSLHLPLTIALAPLGIPALHKLLWPPVRRAVADIEPPGVHGLLGLRGLVITATVAAVSALGLFLQSSLAWLFFALIPAATLGLLARTRAQAVIPALVGMLAGVGLATIQFMAVSGTLPQAALGYLGQWLFMSTPLAAAGAEGVRRLLGSAARPARLRAILAAAGLVMVLAGMWHAGIQGSKTYGWSPVDPPMATILATPPQAGNYTTDEQVYLRIFYLMRAGTPYYEASTKARAEVTEGRPGYATGALTFRLPTIFWLWDNIPGPANRVIVNSMLVFGSLAVIAAFLLILRFAPPGVALGGATLVATYMSHSAASVVMMNAEIWAACLGLVAAAAWIWADARIPGARLLPWVAALFALGAAACREIAVFYLLAGLVSSLAMAGHARRTAWIPWGIGIAGFIALFAAHVSATGQAVFSGTTSATTWFQPDAQRGLRVLAYGGEFIMGHPITFILVVLAGLVAAAVVLRGRGRSFALMACVLPAIAFTVVGPLGFMSGTQSHVLALGYWGTLFIPLALTLSPLVALMDPAPDTETVGA